MAAFVLAYTALSPTASRAAMGGMGSIPDLYVKGLDKTP